MIKAFVLTFIFLISTNLWGKDIYYFNSIEVNCFQNQGCERYQDRYDSLKDVEIEIEDLKELFRLSLTDDGIREFNYSIAKQDDSSILKIFIKQNPIIENIQFKANVELQNQELEKYVTFKVGSYYNKGQYETSVENLKKYLTDRGFQGIEIKMNTKEKDDGVVLDFDIFIDKILKVKRVEVVDEQGQYLFDIEKRFFGLYDEVVDELKFSLLVDQLSNEFFQEGYFNSKVEVQPKTLVGDRVVFKIKITKGNRFLFSFYGKSIFSRYDLSGFVRNEIKKNVVVLSSSELIDILKARFNERGIYGTKITFREASGKTKFKENFKTTYFYIKQGKKAKITKIDFKGNSIFSDEELLDFYYEKSSVLAGRDILDNAFLDDFKRHLRIKYLEKGYIFVEVTSPRIIMDEETFESTVSYRIRENDPAFVDKVLLNNISSTLAQSIREKITNKPETPLNVIALENDINLIEREVREAGYYFAKIVNNNKREMVQYSKNYEKASLNISFFTGKKAIFQNLIITGNIKTRNIVIAREVLLNRGDIITPKTLSDIRDRLSGLNLFSSINITPLITNEDSNDDHYHINLVINVREKDSISLVLAPGFRTDLGVKLSTELSFNNFTGMDRELSITANANQRLNFSNLDDRRRREEKRMIEYSLKTSFLEPYLFGKKIEFETSLTGSRKRFRGFDADIIGYSASLSKTFWDFFTTSLEYQLEIISQFDATEEKDRGSFRIGSITPSIALDFRNNKVNPTSGLFMALSWEFANPYFYSQKNEELTINFNRLVSRNKFYLPVTDNFSFAFSIAAGVEKNFSSELKNDGSGETKGFIPSIKVFRLDGIDTVRGYRDVEINRVESGEDISDFRIDNMAYFGVFKFEPRYLLDDTMMLALFFDAGRVYVNHFKPLDMRTSAGLSFKLLTPVGSLDFDYGAKLKRNYDNFGGRETFGRFHLSIGFF